MRTEFSATHSFPPRPGGGGEATLLRRRVCELMTRTPVTVPPFSPAADALNLARRLGFHHLPVVISERVAGILCSCDLLDAASDTPVSQVMTQDPLTITSSAPIGDALKLMRSSGVGCLPVTLSNRLVGIITRGDLQRAGLLLESECPCCKSCGSHHHVKLNLSETPFCLRCLDQLRQDETFDLFEELGGED